MRTVVVLMDTLRRNMLTCYNPETFVNSPCISSFSKEATTFDQHWIGSAPCMPARRDILTGRLNFLERSWGPIEPFDCTLPQVLKDHGIFTHITTDHCHYFRQGGEGYVQQFNTWDYHRGQEGDPWVSRIDDPSNMPASFYGRVRNQYQWNRSKWEKEEDMPSPKTFQSACDWLEDNQKEQDFFLMVEAFDPHEPFDVPESYMEQYGSPKLDKEYYEIPEYQRVNVPDEAIDYIQKRYAALLSMTDHYFGKLIDKLKALAMYEDTMVVLTTDHGYFLGEREYLGKNYMHLYNELAHLPFIIKFPKQALQGERISAITQNIDLMPTILDFMGIDIPRDVQGVSLKPLLNDKKATTKPYALYGYHAMAMNLSDATHTYLRAPNKENKPCYEYTCLPTTIRKWLGKGVEKEISVDRYFKRTEYPLYRIPVTLPGIIESPEVGIKEVSESKLFDIEHDYEQIQNLAGSNRDIEHYYERLMSAALDEYDAPQEQKIRLGLK